MRDEKLLKCVTFYFMYDDDDEKKIKLICSTEPSTTYIRFCFRIIFLVSQPFVIKF